MPDLSQMPELPEARTGLNNIRRAHGVALRDSIRSFAAYYANIHGRDSIAFYDVLTALGAMRQQREWTHEYMDSLVRLASWGGSRGGGRPEVPDHEKRVKKSVSLSPDLVAFIEKERGAASFSEYLETLATAGREAVRPLFKVA